MIRRTRFLDRWLLILISAMVCVLYMISPFRPEFTEFNTNSEAQSENVSKNFCRELFEIRSVNSSNPLVQNAVEFIRDIKDSEDFLPSYLYEVLGSHGLTIFKHVQPFEGIQGSNISLKNVGSIIFSEMHPIGQQCLPNYPMRRSVSLQAPELTPPWLAA